VAVLTLNRPEHLNAYTADMGTLLGRAYQQCDDDDDVRAIVVTGAGRAFCAGARLAPKGETFNGSREPGAYDGRYPGPSLAADQLLTPVIADINGSAVGAGITMAINCDIRLVAEDAKIGFVFNRRGVIPDADLLWFLPRIVGYPRPWRSS
jgi:enoyl-CoA hydratase/carnithine racemase